MDKITMEDIMQWLEAQRTEANARLAALGDGEESYAEHSPESKAVRIINAIVKRMGEMSAVEYLETHQKMCVEHLNIDNFPPSACTGCPLENPHCNCEYFALHYPRQAVEIVKKWKEEQDGTKTV